jgi:hypothetical protein
MASPERYRKLADKLGLDLWTADSMDDCRDIEQVVEECQALATKLENLPPRP